MTMTDTARKLGIDEASTPHPATGLLPVGPHWTGFGGAFGGLMVAAAARSMQQLVPDGRALRSIHADLLGAVQPGELAFDPSVDRAGRSVTFASTAGSQAGRDRIVATAVFGDSAAGPDYGPVTRAVMPVAPSVVELDTWDQSDTPALRMIEYKPASATLPLQGAPGSNADFHVWMRVAEDDAPVDAARALALLDAPAPGLYATVTTPFPIPTVEFTAHLLPALETTTTAWALARMQTVVAGEGYSIDDCELWNEDGQLIAMARQLRRAIVL